MKKLLHERLREIAPRISKSCDDDWGIDELREAMNVACYSTYQSDLKNTVLAIADEIEKYYDPKPRDTEGNPVHKDMELDGGVVSHWSVYEDGSWAVFDSNYDEIQCGDKDEPIRMPEPKVLDADGVEIKVGDTVYDTSNGKALKVTEVLKSSVGVIGELGCGSILAEHITHREPDSLEKLRDDMNYSIVEGTYPRTAHEYLCRCAKRLTAIMERDA